MEKIVQKKCVSVLLIPNFDELSISFSRSASIANNLVGKTVGVGDSYNINSNLNEVLISSKNPRGLLYGVYHYLKILGCRWPMPKFDYCSDLAEYIPLKSEIQFSLLNVAETPTFAFRGGLCATMAQSKVSESRLIQLADWMAKQRLNIFGIHIRKYDLISKVVFDALEDRGFLVSCEGHSWTFLNNKYASSSAKDSLEHVVSAAVNFYRDNPEISFYGPWANDNTSWKYSEYSIHSPSERAVNFYSSLWERMRISSPLPVLIYPAYQSLLTPQNTKEIPKNTLCYLCPIDRDHGRRIYDEHSNQNAKYARAVKRWQLTEFKHNLVYYTYFRKHSWKSLPVNTPGLINDEFYWANENNFYGVTTYFIDSDWLAYHLQHFSFATLAWEGGQSKDSLIAKFIFQLTGAESSELKDFFIRYENFASKYDGGGYWGYKIKGLRRSAMLKPEFLKDVHSLYDALDKVDTTQIKADILDIHRKWVKHWEAKLKFATAKEGQEQDKLFAEFRDILLSRDYVGLVADYVKYDAKLDRASNF